MNDLILYYLILVGGVSLMGLLIYLIAIKQERGKKT